MNILEFMSHSRLLGDSFQGETREAWRAVLSGAFALPMDDDRLELFNRLSGGRKPPKGRVNELWVVAGRRSDKTHTMAAIGLYMATVAAQIEGLINRLSVGERAVVAILAVDRSQATLAFQYLAGMVENSPTLAGMIKSQDREAIHFTNKVSIEVHTNSFRAIRGRTLLALLLDECAFYRSEAVANPDIETYRAAIPGLATLNGMLIGVSSPYARRGLLYQKYRDHFGRTSDDVLVIQGGTKLFNPTIDPKIIEDAMRDDPEAARAEWLGEFRSDLEAFIARDTIESLARTSPLELPFNNKYRYFAFTDPSGGGQDEFCLAIAHLEADQIIVDSVQGRKGAPHSIVAEYADTLKRYRISQVYGDRYAGSWPSDEFKKYGIKYIPSEKPKSDLYVDALPMLNSGRIEIPPHQKLINQFSSLERRTTRSGKDSIDHPPSGHDDYCNVVAGVAVHCKKPQWATRIDIGFTF